MEDKNNKEFRARKSWSKKRASGKSQTIKNNYDKKKGDLKKDHPEKGVKKWVLI